MISSYLSEAIVKAVRGAGLEPPESLGLETPRDPAHGDLATNVAMQLAGRAGRPPRALAEAIVERLRAELDPARIEAVKIAGPGFINFTYRPVVVHEALAEILRLGAEFGRSSWGSGQKVLLEFVSANPTGPLNVVSARAAAVGDALRRLFRASGYEADAEFYVNDAGNQVRLLGESLRARILECDGQPLHIPENGYHGEYLREMAVALGPEGRARLVREEAAAPGACAAHALEVNLAGQRADLDLFGVRFDRFFHESELHGAGKVLEALGELRKSGHVLEQDGATWFRSTDFGDDKDRVLVRANGEPTYFLADVAYHRTKHARGYQRAINFLGPDHHGTVARITAAMQALGYGEDWLEVQIVQQVNLLEGGKPVEMSKRAGKLIQLRELVEEVGADVARFFFLMRSVKSHLDFDLDLAREHSDKNPVLYVQYAHARACNVQRFAAENGVGEAGADLSLLTQPEEMALIKQLMQLPLMVELAVRSREPQRVTQFLISVAQAFHPFYHKHRVVTSDPKLSSARLRLVSAVRQVIANGLGLLGVSAPERM